MKLKPFSLLVLIYLSGAACSDSTGPDRSHVGTYELSTINGRNLPGTIFEVGDQKTEIVSGSVVLNFDQSFSNELFFRITEGGVTRTERETVSGTYTRSDFTIQLVTDDGFTLAATYDGNRITQTLDRLVLSYVR